MAKLQLITEAQVKDPVIHGGLRDLASYSDDFSDYIIYFSEDADNSVVEVSVGLKENLLALFVEVQDMNENGSEHDTFEDSDMEAFSEILDLIEECINNNLTYFTSQPTH